MKVKIINKSNNPLPEYQTKGSAGMDIRASIAIESYIRIAPGARALISTGLYLEIPQGYEAQIRTRSGMAVTDGIAVLNSPGTIDSDFRGELKVVLINHSNTTKIINNGDRIAQMVFAKYEKIELEESEVLEETERGSGGFGSTGTK